jgi:cysteine desulfurase/selenocysteine lyase
LIDDAYARLSGVPGITLHGPARADDRGALISFMIDGVHPHDVGEIIGREGVCVRTGHHCAQPLMRRLGATATTRASYSVFSTRQDTDRLLHGLESVARIMQL